MKDSVLFFHDVEQCAYGYLHLSAYKLKKLHELAEAIKKWNGLDLVAKSTISNLFKWHINDALSIFNLLISEMENPEQNIIDFGAGSGVVAASLQIAFIKYDVVDDNEACESLHSVSAQSNIATDSFNISGLKNIIFIERISTKLTFIKNILKCERAYLSLATFQRSSSSVNNIFIIRGVSRIRAVLKLVHHFASKIIFFKSTAYEEEIAEASRCWNFDYMVYKRCYVEGVVVLLKNISKKV